MLRKATVIAMLKPGKDPKITTNFCLVSLVSVCLQLSECLTCGLAYVCIAETVEDILNPDKAGFWKSCSTCDQVAALTAYIEQVFQYQLKTGTVFLDLTVAYDTMWHTGLLVKLSKNMPVHEAVHVPVSSVVTCLGVQFDSHLTFTPHVQCLACRCFYHLRQLRSVRQSV